MTEYRVERDTMGEVRLPKEAYYGAQTQRAVENFPISGQTAPPELIHALGLVKWCAARVNRDLGLLSAGRAPLSETEIDALLTAAREVADGKWDGEFPIDVYQTGSGTSTNMNANEVIASRAAELAGYDRFAPEKKIHPNDNVNRGQSTNDIYPTAIHVAVARAIHDRLLPALSRAAGVLTEKARAWDTVLKSGRTHLADATPLSLGQEIGGMARQMELAVRRAAGAVEELRELPAGGTAVGSGINTHKKFGAGVAAALAEETKIPFVEAENHFEANAQRDGLVAAHALIKGVAVSLTGVANNIRWLSSGPRCGIGEIRLADLQPGSSIMPGKVNPVLCEALMQAAAKVIGNDAAISLAGASGGQFQLNIMMPMMADTALESVRILAGGVAVFTKKCLALMEPNEDACRASLERSLMTVTGLNLYIGYEKAAALAKKAHKTGKTIREVCEEENVLSKEELDKALDPRRMIKPLG
ncbi:MAG: class II fumarate hydratase [Thermoguttaceae bacterium]|nr:class II fumarate hydratase [Thermoguttaceae bacterium]